MTSGRVKFGLSEPHYNRVIAHCKKHNRSVSNAIRGIILRSTNNLSDLSVADQGGFHDDGGPRYDKVEVALCSDYISIIRSESEKRFRSMSSLLYMITSSATGGFMDFSILENDLVRNKPTQLVTTSKEEDHASQPER